MLTPVGAPVQADKRNVLQENEIHWDLLNDATSKTDDKGAAFPSDALERIYTLGQN